MPLDNIKTRLQTQQLGSSSEGEAKKAVDPNNPKYKDITNTARSILKEKGLVRGFFAGTVSRTLFSAPGAAVSWGSYEFAKSII